MIGTWHGLLTIMFRIAQEFWTGGLSLDNNYITSLTSTATGHGILFALIASYLRKEKVKVSILELQGSLCEKRD
jgi:hypothetical protein